ncbi:Uncharacterized protein PCOAH_00011460 [Plasmodium coatneyi]|uniref:Generative cell specific-1/HAP2 domain-containing protein n=1 Tax=Plasmodium coatneyi TaxID=208452 RepID=A0A1B1DVE4_9APIC|nr:Uncharacterized protein PCOAH_00011460 [Plasmodium coatneyi]ANQ06740.1 Uncharacterized protein PCOAH_00011460 [Plasmodium coatneyi]
MGRAGLRAVVLFLLLHLGVSRTTDDGDPPERPNTYSLHFNNKQRYVVRRDVGSPYRSFFLYVEEVHKTSVVYPLRYVNQLGRGVHQRDATSINTVMPYDNLTDRSNHPPLKDFPIKYFEKIVPYTRREIKGKKLKHFCEEKKKLYENVDSREICFCCYCSPHPVFPLYSRLKYQRQKILCRRRVTDGEETVILTLKCLKKSKRKYHAFFVQRSSNSFMVKVTFQEFNLTDEFFLSRNDKSALERRTYLLDPSNSEIDDEVFNVRLKFLAERTHRGDSIEGNYLFLDSDVFKRRVVLDDSFADEEVLENGLIVNADHVDEKGTECKKVTAYPNVWEEKKGFCKYGRNHCLKGQLAQFIYLEGKLDVKKRLRHNYSFFMGRKTPLGGRTINGSRSDHGDNPAGNSNHANDANFATAPPDLEEDYHMSLQKRAHNFAEITSHNGEGLQITHEEDVLGESVSLVHMLSNCYDFNNQVDPSCSVYISIWNAEEVEKEVKVSITCERRIMADETTLRRNVILAKKGESSVVIKFKPAVDLLVTPCRVVVQRQKRSDELQQQQKGNIRGESPPSSTAGGDNHKDGNTNGNTVGNEDSREANGQYFTFSVGSNGEKEETAERIIWDSPLQFNDVPWDIIQMHKKRLELLEGEDYGPPGEGVLGKYTGKVANYFSGCRTSVKVFFLLVCVILVGIFVLPSVHPLNGLLLKRKWFYTLRKIRMLFVWAIQDACLFVHRIVKRAIKGFKFVLVKVCRVVFRRRRKRRKEKQLIGDAYLHKQTRRRKKDEKKRNKKIKGEKLKREQEELRRRRHKRLMLHEAQCKGELHPEKNEPREKHHKKGEHPKKDRIGGDHHGRTGQSKRGDSSSESSACSSVLSASSSTTPYRDSSGHASCHKGSASRGKKNHRTRHVSKRGEGEKTHRVVASPSSEQKNQSDKV